jgi:hypothetical protein
LLQPQIHIVQNPELKISCSCCSVIPDYGNVDEAGMMPNNINFMPKSMKIGQFVPPFEEDMLTRTRRSMDISRGSQNQLHDTV